MAKIYTQIVNACWECPELYCTYSYKCRKNCKNIERTDIIQEWCPLSNVITDNFICEISVEECEKCGVECAEKEIKLLLK